MILYISLIEKYKTYYTKSMTVVYHEKLRVVKLKSDFLIELVTKD
jgi:hypothetical protein